MSAKEHIVYLVDDDPSVRDALSLLLGLWSHPVVVFADAESFLAAYRADWCGCLLVDVRMPGIDGITLQKHLLEIGCTLPVIVMTGHGSVGTAREAFRAQAVDFLEKPIDHARLKCALDEAFARQATTHDRRRQSADAERLRARLTPREREVMDLVVTGRHNREVAEALGISTRTVEVHKARLMAKLGVDSVPALVRLSLAAGEPSAAPR